jgi:hypothetical protein
MRARQRLDAQVAKTCVTHPAHAIRRAEVENAFGHDQHQARQHPGCIAPALVVISRSKTMMAPPFEGAS